jgi:hypothetical protein
MSDFSLTTLFVVPVGQTTLPSTGSTQNLTAGQVGVFLNDYTPATAGNIYTAPYFYIAQGRTNTYLMGSKRSDKIKGCRYGRGCRSNVLEWYKVGGCPTPIVQITDIDDWNVKCGEIVTLTIRAHSSYLDTLYFNGLTRSVTVQAPCCECGGDPCDNVDVDALIDAIIVALELQAPGINPDNITLNQFFTFQRIGTGVNAILRISGKALTRYAVPCDVAAFPFEYDKMRFRTFVYSGPATTADFIVSDACNIVAVSTIVQNSSYAHGTSDEVLQLEKNFHSYQVGMLKHLYTKVGYNQTFEDWVNTGSIYDMYYIKFTEYDEKGTWGDYIPEDETVQIACVAGGAFATALEAVLEAALGTVVADNVCLTTTSTTAAPTTTTTTTAAATTTTTTTT